MIRDKYIDNCVLKIYSGLDSISFPLNLRNIVTMIPKCKYMSYQKFAQVTGCSIDDVVQICESRSGCTHYDKQNDRYLILCNRSTDHNNNLGRQRWTLCHEIGHVICGHHQISAYAKLAEHNLVMQMDPAYEAEADYFAATLLAPFPLFKLLNIRSPIDVQNTFYLSTEASVVRFDRYLKWKKFHQKTAWENDMIRTYINKQL